MAGQLGGIDRVSKSRLTRSAVTVALISSSWPTGVTAA